MFDWSPAASSSSSLQGSSLPLLPLLNKREKEVEEVNMLKDYILNFIYSIFFAKFKNKYRTKLFNIQYLIHASNFAGEKDY